MDAVEGGGGDADVKRAFGELSAARDEAKAFSADDAETAEEDADAAASEPDAAEEAGDGGNDGAIQIIAADAKGKTAEAEKAEADSKVHPEKPDSRDDPDVGEPGADEVEGSTPVPPGVMGRGLRSIQESTTSHRAPTQVFAYMYPCTRTHSQLFAHSVPVHPFTLAASSSLASQSVPFELHFSTFKGY
jgi:hypothetical protein